MHLLAKSIPYYLESKKKQIIKKSHLPCSEELKGKFTLTKTLFKTSELIKYLGPKIIRNSIVHIPAEYESVFFSYSWDSDKWER